MFIFLQETRIGICICFFFGKRIVSGDPMLIVSYEISLKGLILLFLPLYYSETLGRFKYDVSGLFNFTSIYRLYNLAYETKL